MAKLSPYIDVDSLDKTICRESEFALEQELSYACHLDVPAILFTLRGPNCANLARIVYSQILGLTQYQVWIHVPMQSPIAEAAYWRSDIEELENPEDSTWNWSA